MLQQPKTDPIDTLARRIAAHGVDMQITRKGRTIFVRNMDAPSTQDATRALKIVSDYADLHFLVIDAHVPSVLGHLDAAYVANGFLVGFEAEEDEEHGRHHVMRRKPRK
jgi:hypothetical protein